jgi:hypothetical protein
MIRSIQPRRALRLAPLSREIQAFPLPTDLFYIGAAGMRPAAKVKEDAMTLDPVTLITSASFIVAAMWSALVVLVEYYRLG